MVSTLLEISSNEPFLIFRLPGGEFVRLDGATVDGAGVIRFPTASITPWPGANFNSLPIVPKCESTPFDTYGSNVNDIVETLKKEGGKAVISRNICGIFSRFALPEIAESYFEQFPDMFCFLFHHPDTGYWMGASPELLLQKERDNLFVTRALAGTRKVDSDIEWDSKNLREHAFVVEDIRRRALELQTTDVRISTPCNFHYGDIEHLCTPIEIGGDVSFDTLAAALHPTPAVCGTPRHRAMEHIAAAEDEARKYYGGMINIDNRVCYVILRCVHFDSEHWCVYTGSGITADSNAADEWRETEAKARPLTNILKKY